MKKLIMNMLNAAKIWLALPVLVLAVLTLTVAFALSQNNSGDNSKSVSAEFEHLYFAITSQKINYDEIEKSIRELNSKFEIDFAQALILKRKQSYQEAFNILKKHLVNTPEFYPYYEEIVWLGQVNDKLSEVEKSLSAKDANKFKNYLRAFISYQTGNYSEAIKLLENEKDFNQLYLLSHCYRATGDYQKAISLLDSCLIIYPKENSDYAKILISKGSILLLSGNYEDAKKIYQAGYKLARKKMNIKEEAKALVNLAILDDYNGNVDEAQKQLKQAIQLALSIEDVELQAVIYSESGVSYTYLGNVVDARKNYEKSLEIYKKLKNYERLSNLSSNIGLLYIQTGNFSVAIKSFEEGLAFARENVASQILNLRGLGDVYSNLSDYSKALHYYNQAKTLSEKIKNANQKALSEVSIGTLFYNLNNPNKALSIFKQVLNENELLEDPYFIEDLHFKVAIAYSDLDSLHLADEHFQKGFSIAESINDVYYETLISTYRADNFIKMKELLKAELLLNNIMKKTSGYGFYQLLGLQNLYSGILKFEQKKFNDAEKYFSKSEELSSISNDLNTLIEAKFYSAQCSEFQNRLSEAVKKYREAIHQIEKVFSYSAQSSQTDIYHFAGLNGSYLKLTDLYLRQSRFKDAFNLIEQFRARNTLKNLNHLKLQSQVKDDNVLQNFYDVLWKLNSDIYTETEKDSLKKIFSSIKNEISSKYNFNIDSLQFRFDAREDLNKIPDDELIISYYFSKDECFAFVLSQNDFKAVKLNKSKTDILKTAKEISPVYDQLNDLSDAYYNQDLFSFNSQAAYQLYKKIIEPVRDQIAGYKKIIFSLPVELSVVPLEFLVSEFNSDDSPYYYDNKKFLVEDFPISYTPSVSVYLIQKSKPQLKSEKVLLVGDPQISGEDFAQSYRGSLIEDNPFGSRSIRLFPLKYSRDEIEQIESIFSNASVLLSENATEEQFIENSNDKSLIHLSTHSFIHNNQPFIIFSKDEKSQSDGFLETGEIVKLKINSELVVLSSCKSGLGIVDPTEGIIGMQKSFFEAGSKSVIVSLWDVNDKFTSIFMKSFYKFLSEGNDKSEALRKTKIFFKENYSANPYYWAAFVLSGDNSNLNFSQSFSFGMKYSFIVVLLLLLTITIYKFYLLKFAQKIKS
ncbi:CHAT domain-containing protein [Ignavibacterium sp.]|uniref:CHAT domain-containing protein n=1 Tax=Ignavibacterium sp. TaxID=2651167 RepID=UPI00307DC232